MNELTRLFLTAIAIVFLAIGSPVMAGTPDGETPANEGVCDDLIGMTPGLYGLCVAFCEAQDAEATFDLATGEVIFAEGSKPSNPKLLAIYDKKKGDGDPPMPCVNVVANQCPCWTEEELKSVGTGFGVFGEGDRCVTNAAANSLLLLGSDALVFSTFKEFATANPARQECSVSFWEDVVPQGPRIIKIQEITDPALLLCRESLLAECAFRDVVPGPF